MAELSDKFNVENTTEIAEAGAEKLLNALAEAGIDETSENIDKLVSGLYTDDAFSASEAQMRGFWKETFGKKAEPASEGPDLMTVLMSNDESAKGNFVSGLFDKFKGLASMLSGLAPNMNIMGMFDSLKSTIMGFFSGLGGGNAPAVVADTQAEQDTETQEQLETVASVLQPGGLDAAAARAPFQNAANPAHQSDASVEPAINPNGPLVS